MCASKMRKLIPLTGASPIIDYKKTLHFHKTKTFKLQAHYNSWASLSLYVYLPLPIFITA